MENKVWVYKMLYKTESKWIVKMTNYGAEGWELICVDNDILWFKKEL